MIGVVVFTVTTAGALAGGIFGARLLRLTDPLDWLLAASLLVCTQVVIVSLVVGAVLHHYEVWALVTAVAASDLVLLLAVRRFRPAAAGTGDVAAVVQRTLASLAGWQRLVVAVAAVALLWRVALAALLPPFAYDALTYHLTAVASWIQSGSIDANPYAPCCARYPANAELLFAWPTVLLGRDTLTDMVQIGLTLFAALAVAGLGRRWDVRRRCDDGRRAVRPDSDRPDAGEYELQDVALASMLVVALYFAYRLSAILASTRPAAPGAPWTTTRYRRTRGRSRARNQDERDRYRHGRDCARHRAPDTRDGPRANFWPRHGRGRRGVCVRDAAGRWVVVWGQLGRHGKPSLAVRGDCAGRRGVRRTGEPQGLSDGAAGFRSLVAAPDRRSWYADVPLWRRNGYTYEERTGGLGPVWSWLGSILLAVGMVATIRRRRDVFVTILVPLALLFALLPYRWWSRFTIYLAALGAIAILAVIEHLRPSRARTALVTATDLSRRSARRWRRGGSIPPVMGAR